MRCGEVWVLDYFDNCFRCLLGFGVGDLVLGVNSDRIE